jgi:hypothetical protein
MRRIVLALLATVAAGSLGGCYAYAPAPAYYAGRPAAVWVPGHWNGPYWVPGHWAR